MRVFNKGSRKTFSSIEIFPGENDNIPNQEDLKEFVELHKDLSIMTNKKEPPILEVEKNIVEVSKKNFKKKKNKAKSFEYSGE